MTMNQRPRGLSCPECATLIVVDINDLLITGKLTCPNCKLELQMDRHKSAESIQVLTNFQGEFQTAEQHYEEAQYTSKSTVERRTRSRRTTTRTRRRAR